jgi:hypothetical protein
LMHVRRSVLVSGAATPNTPIAVGRQVRHIPLNFLDQPDVFRHAERVDHRASKTNDSASPPRQSAPRRELRRPFSRSTPGSKGKHGISFLNGTILLRNMGDYIACASFQAVEQNQTGLLTPPSVTA